MNTNLLKWLIDDMRILGFDLEFTLDPVHIKSKQGDSLGILYALEPIKSWVDGRVLSMSAKHGRHVIERIGEMAYSNPQNMPDLYIVLTKFGLLGKDKMFSEYDPALLTKEDLKKKDNMIKELGGTAYKIN